MKCMFAVPECDNYMLSREVQILPVKDSGLRYTQRHAPPRHSAVSGHAKPSRKGGHISRVSSFHIDEPIR